MVGKSRDRLGWEQLADVQVPRGIVWWLEFAALYRHRRTDKALAELRDVSSQLGMLVGTTMRESDERNERLLDLQASVERLTRRLVVLTVVLGLIGVGSYKSH